MKIQERLRLLHRLQMVLGYDIDDADVTAALITAIVDIGAQGAVLEAARLREQIREARISPVQRVLVPRMDHLYLKMVMRRVN